MKIFRIEIGCVAKTLEGSVTNCRNVKNHILSKYLWFSQVQFFKKSIFILARLPRSSTYQWYFLPTPQPQVYVTNSNICHQANVSKFLGDGFSRVHVMLHDSYCMSHTVWVMTFERFKSYISTFGPLVHLWFRYPYAYSSKKPLPFTWSLWQSEILKKFESSFSEHESG